MVSILCSYPRYIIVSNGRIVTFILAQGQIAAGKYSGSFLYFFFLIFFYNGAPCCAVDFSTLTYFFAFAGNIYVCSLLVALAVSGQTFINCGTLADSCECNFLRILFPKVLCTLPRCGNFLREKKSKTPTIYWQIRRLG